MDDDGCITLVVKLGVLGNTAFESSCAPGTSSTWKWFSLPQTTALITKSRQLCDGIVLVTDGHQRHHVGQSAFLSPQVMTSDLEEQQSAFWRMILSFVTDGLSVVLMKIGKNIKMFKRRHFCTCFNEQRIKQTCGNLSQPK